MRGAEAEAFDVGVSLGVPCHASIIANWPDRRCQGVESVGGQKNTWWMKINACIVLNNCVMMVLSLSGDGKRNK